MKIVKIEITSFRGITKTLVIDLADARGNPQSLILLGDNGSGKSSIMDAIEFCLQGHISQSESNFSFLKSLAVDELPNVKITLENGEVFYRRLIRDEQGYLCNIKGTNPHFSISPFVLRRHDILRFIESSDAEKTLVFSNYLRESNSTNWVQHPDDTLTNLLDERLKLKQYRDELRSKLAIELRIDIDEIPYDRKEFSVFVKEYIYKGFSPKQLKEQGFNIKINDAALETAKSYFDAAAQHRTTKQKINEYSGTKINLFPKHLLPQLKAFLEKVSEKLTSSFLEISPLDYIKKLNIEYDDSNVLALKVVLFLKNGRRCSPNQILSEANLDLLSLMFFISFINESSERGQAPVLILDDVLQSIDATIRVSFVNYLLRNFPNWQIFITAHDRLWFRQVYELMLLHNHTHMRLFISNWTFDNGPSINNSRLYLEESLCKSLEDNNLFEICSIAGLLLEQMSETLSVNLNTSIHRKKDDRYTIGDLWPGIAKSLKKTKLKTQIEAIEVFLHIRNLIGAHYNEWAQSISLADSLTFGNSVLNLYRSVHCNKCNRWISSSPQLSYFSCKCGTIIISNS